MSDTMVRTAGGIIRRAEVIPSVAGPTDTALLTLSREIGRLCEKSTTRGLTKDDAQCLSMYVKALKDVRELQKDLAKDSDVQKLELDQLRELAQGVLATSMAKSKETT